METKGIPQFEDIFKELVLPEWLEGKEVSLYYLKEGNGDRNNMMETCRCFQSLYEAICSARFNLACACRREYPELLASNNPQLSHVWMRSQFVNNSILWYNATFDLALQPLWMYYKIYEKSKKKLSLTTESLDKLLETCKFDFLKRNGITEIGEELISKLNDLNKNLQSSIRLWANILKHRKKIEYIELSKKEHPIAIGGSFAIEKDEHGKNILRINEGEYNSSKTIKRLRMDEVINKLFSFHQQLIPITKDIDDKIKM